MKKIKLTPLQNSIIWILEEAGEETSGTLRATLRAQGHDSEDALTVALDGLEQIGFIMRIGLSVALTKNGRAALTR